MDTRHPDVSDDFLEAWQEALNLVADLARIPAALIMRVEQDRIEVFLASESTGNPYEVGESEHYVGSGLYCERVLKTREPLLVPDALSDPEWAQNPDVRLNMIAYYGLPLHRPDGSPFGTICVLDRKPNTFGGTVQRLLGRFRVLVEHDLALIKHTRDLEQALSEVETLRGIIPICCVCKKIRDDQGFWEQVERYVAGRSLAHFSHTLCPDCLEREMQRVRKCHGVSEDP